MKPKENIEIERENEIKKIKNDLINTQNLINGLDEKLKNTQSDVSNLN